MSNKKAIVLLSGGLDSATTLYYAVHKGYDCTCLIFSYGQRHRREIDSAKRLARRAGCAWRLVKIDLPWGGSSLLNTRESLSGKKQRGIPRTYVPGRNSIFLSYAVSCAEAEGASAVFIGAHSQDYSGYPDCRPEFIRAFERMARQGTRAGATGTPISIAAPLLHDTKARIITRALQLGVPLELTWSCYRGTRHPCGVCDSCRYRKKGFKEAGIADPAQSYARKNR